MDYPDRWIELSQEQKRLANRYIDTMLAQQMPLIPIQQKPNREIVERIEDSGISYQLEKVKCGKDCKGCPHGPYWYAYYRNRDKVVSKYIGKELRKINSYVTNDPGHKDMLHKTEIKKCTCVHGWFDFAGVCINCGGGK